eukprot:4438842-Pyramimonas_sp.AAC.1
MSRWIYSPPDLLSLPPLVWSGGWSLGGTVREIGTLFGAEEEASSFLFERSASASGIARTVPEEEAPQQAMRHGPRQVLRRDKPSFLARRRQDQSG